MSDRLMADNVMPISGRREPAMELQNTVPAGPLHRTGCGASTGRSNLQRHEETPIGDDAGCNHDLGKFKSVPCRSSARIVVVVV